MMEEIWKDIEGYEGIYQVSNLGRVRSLDRYYTRPHPRNGVPTKYFKRGTEIVCHVHRNGYVEVMLKVGGVKKNFMVHRLVAKAFVPGYFEGADVNHKDCNRQNNHADNLEWMTIGDNLRYGFENGKFSSSMKCVLVSASGERLAFRSMSEAGRYLGRSPGYISKCNLWGRDAVGNDGEKYSIEVKNG